MGSISLPVPLTEFSYPLNPSVISPALAFTFNQLLPPCSLGQLLLAAGPPPWLFLGFPNEWERAPLWGKAQLRVKKTMWGGISAGQREPGLSQSRSEKPFQSHLMSPVSGCGG